MANPTIMEARMRDLDAAQAHPAYQRAIRKAAWYALRGRPGRDTFSVYFDGAKMSFLFPDLDDRPAQSARRIYTAEKWKGSTLLIRIPGYKSFLYDIPSGIVPAAINHDPIREGWFTRWTATAPESTGPADNPTPSRKFWRYPAWLKRWLANDRFGRREGLVVALWVLAGMVGIVAVGRTFDAIGL